MFVTVASERSFSKAAKKLRRTQPAVSQAIRRLEKAAGERLIDRSSRDGTLTDAGELLLEYAHRLLRLAGRGRGRRLRTSGRQEGPRDRSVRTRAPCTRFCPLIEAFQRDHPGVFVEVRRLAAGSCLRKCCFAPSTSAIITFKPAERGLDSVLLGTDELVLLVPPGHALASSKEITMEEMGRQSIIAHNDPSPARERVLRLYEQRHAPLNILMSLPSLDGIKRAVEMGLGLALLPRRCAQAEIARGQLAAVDVPDLRSPRETPARLSPRRRALSRRPGVPQALRPAELHAWHRTFQAPGVLNRQSHA